MAMRQHDTYPPLASLFEPTSGGVRRAEMPMTDREGTLTRTSWDGITLIDSEMRTSEATAPWKHYNTEAFVELNFMLEGNMSQSSEGLYQHHQQSTGYSNLLFNPSSLEESRLIGSGNFRCFGIHFATERLKHLISGYIPQWSHLAEKIDNGKPFVLHSHDAVLPLSLKYLFNRVWSHPQSDGLSRLHFEAFTMKILSLQCEALSSSSPQLKATISKEEQERLVYARELLLLRLSHPPTIRELSLLIGLNEFKLKDGFRKLWDTSVMGFVQEQRLEAARTAIYTGGKNISEIAYGLGYAHPQHFHRAFKKRYGVTPKSLTK